jgi:hypothetical protein
VSANVGLFNIAVRNSDMTFWSSFFSAAKFFSDSALLKA